MQETQREEEALEYLKAHNITVYGSDVPLPSLSFDEMGIREEIKKTIGMYEWVTPTPIQAVTIPIALKGLDIVGIAKTGSGKTGSFLIPAINKIMNSNKIPKPYGPTVCVLSPTRELAQQTAVVCEQITKNIDVHHACLFGGASRDIQISQLSESPDIIISTPGRLIDMIESGNCSFERINYLVLDEADRMLDLGFEPQIRTIIGKIQVERQTLMFSATWPKEIQSLASEFLKDPIDVIVGSKHLSTNAAIKQIIENIEPHEKLTKCIQIINNNPGKKILLFTNTKRGADDLCSRLHTTGIETFVIHGDKNQMQRDSSLLDFKESDCGILIATDVAARGIDITDISIVINYDFPFNIEDYVHRIGRTARGNREGVAISLFTNDSNSLVDQLIKVLRSSSQEIPEWLLNSISKTQSLRDRYSMGKNGSGYGGPRDEYNPFKYVPSTI